MMFLVFSLFFLVKAGDAIEFRYKKHNRADRFVKGLFRNFFIVLWKG